MNHFNLAPIDRGYQDLGIAIVQQAALDWRIAMRHKTDPKHDRRDDADIIRECEKFLRSGRPEFLTGANGTYILQRLREEFNGKGVMKHGNRTRS